MYDMLIIGSGPAGLGCAVYAKRAGLSCAVFEKNGMSGGQVLLTDRVDNYLGSFGMNGFELGMKFREHADALGVEFLDGEVSSLKLSGEIKEVYAGSSCYTAKTVVIATGAEHMKLQVEGEEAYAGKGVSYCATCDGAFFRGKTVAVVGGGDVAVEDAIYLSGLCEKVYLIHRRDSLRAARSLQNVLFERENVKILWDSRVEQIQGNATVEHIMVENVKNREKKKIDVQGIFIAVGMRPVNQLYEKELPLDESGYVIAGEDCKTGVMGVYAVGDCRTKAVRQIITAVADGANAVASAEKYIRNMA